MGAKVEYVGEPVMNRDFLIKVQTRLTLSKLGFSMLCMFTNGFLKQSGHENRKRCFRLRVRVVS